MPELFAFLLKVNIALVLFCAGYYLVLRKLTFYTLNRAYLVTAIIFSTVYPFVDLSAIAQRHRQIVEPVQNVVIVWKAPAESLVKQAAYWNWLEAAFWTVTIIMAMRLMSQLFSLYNIYRRSNEREINGQTVRVVNGDISPFSFWQSIFINPDKLSPADLHNILAHEQIHVKEWHTLDILLSEISVIFYWFNPGVWMVKRAIRENIEFITDRKILKRGVDSRAYQYSLLNVSFNQHAPAALTSNFNFSTLKKRIKMMNAKRSSNINLTRYALLVPVVTVCLFAFSLSKAETVKINPVINSIKAATVKTLNKLDAAISLPADTTPKPKRVTRTIIITTDGSDKVNVTTNEKVLEVLNIKADTSRGVSNATGTLSYRSLSGFNSVNLDTINTIMINGKKGTREDLSKIIGDMPKPGTQNLREIVVNGKPFITNSLTYKTDGKDVLVSRGSGGAYQGGGGYITLDSVRKVNGLWFARNKDSINRTSSLRGFNYAPNTNRDLVVNGFRISPSPLSGTESISSGSPTNFKGKLIVINGKIATENELKKVSVIDIEETISLPGKTAVKYYGEKAKNGAVVITTLKR